MRARIQFVVDEENGTFEAQYLAFNEVPQNMLILTALLEKAFGAYYEKNGNTTSETSDTASASAEVSTADYSEILDLFYYGIKTEWTGQELEKLDKIGLSELWYFFPAGITLHTAGYALTDLDGNGTEELIISKSTDDTASSDGIIYDLYTYKNGRPVHLCSSGQREDYYLCSDHSISCSGSNGAFEAVYSYYCVDENSDALAVKEEIIFNCEEGYENYYYNSKDTPPISESEAKAIIDKYKVLPFDMVLFQDYTPVNASSENSAPPTSAMLTEDEALSIADKWFGEYLAGTGYYFYSNGEGTDIYGNECYIFSWVVGEPGGCVYINKFTGEMTIDDMTPADWYSDYWIPHIENGYVNDDGYFVYGGY